MPIHKFVLAGALLCAATYASGAAALTFTDVPPIETIAAKSSLAFRGVVIGVEYADAQLDTAHSYPYTLTHLRALACYRGCETGQEITIARLGGPRNRDMHHYLMIPGIPSFENGEEVAIFANDLNHPFFGSSYGDYGVLRIARADGGARVVLNNTDEVLRDHAGTLRADASIRCESIASQPQDCVSTAHAVDESADDDDSGRPHGVAADPALSPEALDARMRDIVRAHPLAQAPQSVSGNAQSFERALADAFRRSSAR
jgi:hypothetical protein